MCIYRERVYIERENYLPVHIQKPPTMPTYIYRAMAIYIHSRLRCLYIYTGLVRIYIYTGEVSRLRSLRSSRRIMGGLAIYTHIHKSDMWGPARPVYIYEQGLAAARSWLISAHNGRPHRIYTYIHKSAIWGSARPVYIYGRGLAAARPGS